ncbi:acetyl-CoA carboxylase biotin carboxylase subunit family protein [Kitasatospora gansuensis]
MLPATAQLAETLGLEFHTPDCVVGLTDKQRQRDLVAAAGIDSVRYRLAHDPGELATALAEVGAPAVVKPKRGEGSNHAYPVHGEADAAVVLRLFTDDWPVDGTGRPLVLIVEEFLADAPARTGIGNYVSVESAVVDGVPTQLAVTGKFALATPFRETGQFWPPLMDRQLEQRTADLAGAAIVALSVRSGICHTEIKLTPSGPRLIEVNGRLGRDIAELAQRSVGTDIIALAGRIALGHPVSPAPLRPGQVHFQFHHPSPKAARTVHEVAGHQAVEALPGIDSYRRVQLPAPVSDVSTSHFDVLRGSADSHREMADLIDRASGLLTFSFSGDGEDARVIGTELHQFA